MRTMRSRDPRHSVVGRAYRHRVPACDDGGRRGLFTDRADGSLVIVDGQPVGSALIGQAWEGPILVLRAAVRGRRGRVDLGRFQPGPRSRQLADEIAARGAAIVALEAPYVPGVTAAVIPVDLLTASGSGLDPDISVDAARFQAPRVAAVRGLTIEQVDALIDQHTEGRTLGVLGEPRVNVLELNLALAGGGTTNVTMALQRTVLVLGRTAPDSRGCSPTTWTVRSPWS